MEAMRRTRLMLAALLFAAIFLGVLDLILTAKLSSHLHLSILSRIMLISFYALGAGLIGGMIGRELEAEFLRRPFACAGVDLWLSGSLLLGLRILSAQPSSPHHYPILWPDDSVHDKAIIAGLVLASLRCALFGASILYNHSSDASHQVTAR